MEITIKQSATDYAPDAFERMIGKKIKLTADGESAGMCTLVAADVSNDGESVELTVEMPEGVIPPADVSRFSFRPGVLQAARSDALDAGNPPIQSKL